MNATLKSFFCRNQHASSSATIPPRNIPTISPGFFGHSSHLPLRRKYPSVNHLCFSGRPSQLDPTEHNAQRGDVKHSQRPTTRPVASSWRFTHRDCDCGSLYNASPDVGESVNAPFLSMIRHSSLVVHVVFSMPAYVFVCGREENKGAARRGLLV